MCKYFSCIVTRELKVLWDANNSSHEELVKKAGLNDDVLENRGFVRLEMVPNKQGFFTQAKKDWVFSVDEEGTLPVWFSKNKALIEGKVWKECQVSFKPYKANLKAVGKFLLELPKIKWLDFHGKIDPSWHVSFGVDLVAVWDAAGDAAGDAAWDAAWDAAGDAARDAAWDAARVAARVAVWDAARDAALFARCLLVKDKIDKNHFEHAKARMAVWKAGYALRCDVNGKLFVYAVKKESKAEVKV